jgi:hypothetical protein
LETEIQVRSFFSRNLYARAQTEEGILLRPKKSTIDLAGSGAKYATPEEMKRLLDKLREEDV